MAARVVEVAVPLPVDEVFRYALAADVAEPPEPGTRVLVECGGRRVTGVVVRAHAVATEAEELREVVRVIDAAPALPPALVEILVHAARDALCPPGIALAAALPSGTSPRPARRLALGEGGRRALARGEARGRAAELLRALEARALAETTLRARFADLGGVF